MGRAPCCDKANVKRGPWSPEEDAILKHFVEKHGTGGNWIALPHKAGLRRCGKSCRLRWLNYLRPDIKHGGFSEEEDNIICSLYSSIGSRWSIIAAQLPGRTDNDIKNYWNTKLKKKLLGKGMNDDQQTRRLLAKEVAAAMKFNSSNNIVSEAVSPSNTPSPSVSLTELGQQHTNSPYALESSNVPILLQDPSSSASSESSMSKTPTFNLGTVHYEKDFSQISEYPSLTSILMRALESNKSSNCSTYINPSQLTPSLINPHEAQDAAALYAQRSLNIKSETFDQNDTQFAYSMPNWETCTSYLSGNMWMNEVDHAADTNFSYSLPENNQMNELLFYSNNNNSMQIKEEPANYGMTSTESYWVSQLAAASASDPKSSAYSYILPSEGNSNTASQGIFQEEVIY